MQRSRRQPSSLVPKGVVCHDEHLTVVVRRSALLTSGRRQEVGPLEQVHIPWALIYDTEIGDWLNSEHARRLAAFDREQAAANAAAQASLF